MRSLPRSSCSRLRKKDGSFLRGAPHHVHEHYMTPPHTATQQPAQTWPLARFQLAPGAQDSAAAAPFRPTPAPHAGCLSCQTRHAATALLCFQSHAGEQQQHPRRQDILCSRQPRAGCGAHGRHPTGSRLQVQPQRRRRAHVGGRVGARYASQPCALPVWRTAGCDHPLVHCWTAPCASAGAGRYVRRVQTLGRLCVTTTRAVSSQGSHGCRLLVTLTWCRDRSSHS